MEGAAGRVAVVLPVRNTGLETGFEYACSLVLYVVRDLKVGAVVSLRLLTVLDSTYTGSVYFESIS